MSYHYRKTISQVDICRDILINALEESRTEGKTRRMNQLQDHLWQDIWRFLCQIIEKFTTQLLTLCLLAFMIWMLGVFVVANALNTAITPRPTRAVRPSSTKPTKRFFISVLSARHHKPNSQPFQRKPNTPILHFCPIISPRSSINTYINSILSAHDHQNIHTFERIADDRYQNLRRVAFCREWSLQ